MSLRYPAAPTLKAHLDNQEVQLLLTPVTTRHPTRSMATPLYSKKQLDGSHDNVEIQEKHFAEGGAHSSVAIAGYIAALAQLTLLLLSAFLPV